MGNRSALEETGEKLLTAARTELYLSLRFMGPAFMSLAPVMDLSTRRIGTDAEALRYNPVWLMQIYLEHPYIINRTFLHTVIHCIFRHMYGLRGHPDRELWDLACDIAAESVIDSMNCKAVRRTPSQLREEWYDTLGRSVGVMTAERLYRHFLDERPEYTLYLKLAAEFEADDHIFWDQMEDRENGEKKQNPGRGRDFEGEWKRAAKRVESELSFSPGAAGEDAGNLRRVLEFDLEERLRYRDLLRKFRVYSEECRVDPDSFDYGFYNYGMELYGNMPLIEENEFVERHGIRDLVIAIDTSASVSDEVVRDFLTETASILLEKESFFRKFVLHVVECDARVQADTVITDADEMKNYAKGIELHGGGGTDFRPVFQYVDEMRRAGAMKDFRGLIYFTDGYGRYPEEAVPYIAAFVFPEENHADPGDVPDWILKTYMEGKALRAPSKL